MPPPDCPTGKVAYATEAEAHAAAKLYRQAAYVCPECFQWHLTTIYPTQPLRRIP